MFVVESNIPKNEIIHILLRRIEQLKSGNFSCVTGTPIYSQTHDRWVIPDRETFIFETSALRLIKLMQHLVDSELRHITRRDLWYISITSLDLYNPNKCPKCQSTNIRSEERDTGRKRKDGSAVMTTDLICNDCDMKFTDLVNPYDTLGNDITLIERITGIEKEDLGLHAGQKGFLYGSSRMNAYSNTRGRLELQASPTIMFDLPNLQWLEGFSKIFLLEKESFVTHLVPIQRNERPDFLFLDCIDAAIITSQGYEGKYNKSFVRLCLENGITPFSFHDGDGDGIEMDLIHQHHSQGSAHLPDYLITNPHRMGLFPSVGIATGCPSAPMTKKHIKNLKLQQKRVEEIGDPLYEPEIETLLERGERWELQSLSAIHPTAGQAYIIEYMRNRKIPVKPMPDLNNMREKYYTNYTKEAIKGELEDEVDTAIRDHIREQLVNQVIDKVFKSDAIKSAIKEALNDLDDYEELPDNETLLRLWEDKLSSYISYTTKTVSNMLVNSLCEVSRDISIDEDVEIITVDEDGKITIDPKKMVEALKIDVSRSFDIPEPNEERPDLYGDAIRKCNIDYRTCQKFREALEEKLKDFPPEEEEIEIPEEYEPEEYFDDLEDE